MKITKKVFKRIIVEGIKAVAGQKSPKSKLNEEVVQAIKGKKVNIKIPSFTVKCELHGYETDGGGMIKQPVHVEIDSFNNDFQAQLEKIMPTVIANAINKHFDLDYKVDDRKSYIGGTMGGIPKYFNFNKKK